MSGVLDASSGDVPRAFARVMRAHAAIGSSCVRLVRPPRSRAEVMSTLGARCSDTMAAWYSEHDGTAPAMLGEMEFIHGFHLVGLTEAVDEFHRLIAHCNLLRDMVPEAMDRTPGMAWPLVIGDADGFYLDLDTGEVWEFAHDNWPFWHGPVFESVGGMLNLAADALEQGVATVDEGLLEWDYGKFAELASRTPHRCQAAWRAR